MKRSVVYAAFCLAFTLFALPSFAKAAPAAQSDADLLAKTAARFHNANAYSVKGTLVMKIVWGTKPHPTVLRTVEARVQKPNLFRIDYVTEQNLPYAYLYSDGSGAALLVENVLHTYAKFDGSSFEAASKDLTTTINIGERFIPRLLDFFDADYSVDPVALSKAVEADVKWSSVSFETVKVGSINALGVERTRTVGESSTEVYRIAIDPKTALPVQLLVDIIGKGARITRSVTFSDWQFPINGFSKDIFHRADLAGYVHTDLDQNVVGFSAADFSVVGLDGNPIKFSDYKGKVLVLAFWQTDFEDQAAFFQKCWNSYRVCIWTPRATYDKWAKMNMGSKYDFTLAFDPTGVAYETGVSTPYAVGGTPTYFVIGKDGKIVSESYEGKENLPATLEKLGIKPSADK
jgi:outer membrane lipoprotein-sorting protein/peroxiredoxin